MKKIILLFCLSIQVIYAGINQTDALSPILLNSKELPFQVSVSLADFTIPGGIHSGANAQYGANYLFIAGRTNGLHGFSGNNTFPASKQNTDIIVVNVCNKTVYTRSLKDPLSGLTQKQIDSLSVTSPQSYQSGNTLYITGGYGIDTSTGDFGTKDTLTAIDVPGLICWVKNPESNKTASKYIRQISDPLFRVTGGAMYQTGNNPTLLIFGQNFEGLYNVNQMVLIQNKCDVFILLMMVNA